MKVFAASLFNAFGNDQFFKMMKSPGEVRKLMRTIMVLFLESYETVDAETIVSTLPTPISDAVKSIVMVCRAIYSLVSPVPRKLATVGEVTQVRDMKNPSNFTLSGIVEALTKNTWWQKMFDELLSKGTAGLELWTKAEDLLEAIGQTSDDSIIDSAVLGDALAKIPVWKKATRPGYLEAVENEFLRALLFSAENVMKKQGQVTCLGFLCHTWRTSSKPSTCTRSLMPSQRSTNSRSTR